MLQCLYMLTKKISYLEWFISYNKYKAHHKSLSYYLIYTELIEVLLNMTSVNRTILIAVYFRF